MSTLVRKWLSLAGFLKYENTIGGIVEACYLTWGIGGLHKEEGK